MAPPTIVDIHTMLENYAWQHYMDLDAMKKVKSEYRGMDRDDVHFDINMKKVIATHEEPNYANLTPSSAKPFTLFKTVFTNNTGRQQQYSFKTERTTESVALICRENGWSIGEECEMNIKTPGEVLEFKAGFKHEMHVTNAVENSVCESLSWGVDSTIEVPPGMMTTAELVIEEMQYVGSFSMQSTMQGRVTICLHRRRDNALILALTAQFSEIIRELLASPNAGKDFKAITTLEHNIVKLHTKGACSFQFAMKQHIKLNEEPIKPGTGGSFTPTR